MECIHTLLFVHITRDRQIKLFRLSGAQNPPKSLAVLKWTVLEAQEELGSVLGHSWDPEARSDRISEKKSKTSSPFRSGSQKLRSQKLARAVFDLFKKICSLELLHILFLRAQTITWQNCRNRFWYNYKSWELEVKNYFFSKIDEFLTFFRFAGTGGSLVLPSDREVSRMSPDATPDVSRAKRTPYPGSGGPQAVRSQKLDRRSQKLGQNSDFSCRVFDFLTFWLRTGNTGLKDRCGCASVVPVASGGTIPALASPCGCPGNQN